MILTINGGSSSIKFSLYETGGAAVSSLSLRLKGQIERIGVSGTTLTYSNGGAPSQTPLKAAGLGAAADVGAAADFLITWLEKQVSFDEVKAVGHRIVHGMNHNRAIRIDQKLLAELHRIHLFDPDHLPGEIKLIEIFQKRHPNLPQVACFDTAFHADLPRLSRILPIPRRFDEQGIRRYGFHGLSYAYLLEELTRIAGPEATNGRVILAHLGNGASMTAVREGKSFDTSMGFTPAGGFPMSTRTGDLDPGAAWYMIRKEGLSPKQFNELVNHGSGLLGVSETSSDMQDLLQQESTDVRAAEAVALFNYQVKKWIGSFAAALGGLDTLVFSGGIGENAPAVRSRICTGLGFLGIELDESQNAKNAIHIGIEGARVPVYVIPTDEERMIAKTVHNLLDKAS